MNNLMIKEYMYTKNEFYDFLKNTPQYLILDEDVENYKKMYFVSLKDSKNTMLNIGIFDEGHGIKPSVLQIENQNKIYIAYNNKVSVVDMNKSEVVNTIEGLFVVYELVYINQLEIIIVVSELGIQGIDLNGNIIWKNDTYLIEDYKIEKNSIVIKTEEGERIFNLDSGNEIDND